MIHIVSLKRFKMSFPAPIIDGCFTVADNCWHFRCGHHIGILCKHFSIILPHIFKSIFGNFCFQFYGIIPFIPTCRCWIGFGKYFSLFKICNNVRLFDFVTASFLARVFARNLSASQQIQSRWLADMTDLIELVFGNNIGNRIPVDCGFINSNTPRKYFNRCGFSCVLPLLMCLFCSFRKQRKCRYSNFPLFIGISATQSQKSL